MIQIEEHIAALTHLATLQGFAVEKLAGIAPTAFPILSLTRSAIASPSPRFHLYLSAGVHGDEPAGPLALLKLLQDDLLPRDIDISLLPFLNPSGFAVQTRENVGGFDLNRDFRYPKNEETIAAKTFIDNSAAIHLSLSLHEDWETTGFYLYALLPDADTAIPRAVLEAVRQVGPLEPSEEIDGYLATDGLISQTADFDMETRDDWPEAFLLYSKYKHFHFTTESPSSVPLDQRVSMQIAAVTAAIKLARTGLHPE